jgi:hypothetical protein|tara:strand:- start:830 stop:1021 length:192 start_codon:yes stop_codon:yes gene_type:complete
MNKHQRKVIANATTYIELGMLDTAARVVSGLIRCAMTSKSKQALLEFATTHGLDKEEDFIIYG